MSSLGLEVTMNNQISRFVQEFAKHQTDIMLSPSYECEEYPKDRASIQYDRDGFFALSIKQYEQFGRIDVNSGELLWANELDYERNTLVSFRGSKQAPSTRKDVFFSVSKMAAFHITKICQEIIRPECRIYGLNAYTNGIWTITKGDEENVLIRVGQEFRLPFSLGVEPVADLTSLLKVSILHDNH